MFYKVIITYSSINFSVCKLWRAGRLKLFAPTAPAHRSATAVLEVEPEPIMDGHNPVDDALELDSERACAPGPRVHELLLAAGGRNGLNAPPVTAKPEIVAVPQRVDVEEPELGEGVARFLDGPDEHLLGQQFDVAHVHRDGAQLFRRSSDGNGLAEGGRNEVEHLKSRYTWKMGEYKPKVTVDHALAAD